MSADNLLILQGGGPTTVLNATLRAAVDEARRHGTGKVFGARHGMEGMIRGEVINLDSLTENRLERLARSPGAALGSSRVKPSPPEMEDVLRFLEKLRVRAVLFTGGNGTMRAADMLGEFARQSGYELKVIGIPKTIDNDIQGTDRCPGYASAARFVAQSTRDLGMDVRSLPQPVSILETLGRDVGWLAAASATGKRNECDPPHLVYLPEVPFSMEKFVTDVDTVLRKQSWAIVVVSEGLRDDQGRAVYQAEDASQADALQRPMPGGVSRFLAQAITRELKVRCRDEKPGLVGRSSMLHASRRDLLDAELVGRAGVQAVCDGQTGEMVALKPLRDGARSECELVPLKSVTGSDRTLPAEWLCDGAIPVRQEFLRYLRPLVGELLDYEPVLTEGELYDFQ